MAGIGASSPSTPGTQMVIETSVTSVIFSKRITFPVATAAPINFILNLVINNAYHYSLTEMFIAQSFLDHLKEYPEKLWIFQNT
jgi:hypothetical protein